MTGSDDNGKGNDLISKFLMNRRRLMTGAVGVAASSALFAPGRGFAQAVGAAATGRIQNSPSYWKGVFPSGTLNALIGSTPTSSATCNFLGMIQASAISHYGTETVANDAMMDFFGYAVINTNAADGGDTTVDGIFQTLMANSTFEGYTQTMVTYAADNNSTWGSYTKSSLISNVSTAATEARARARAGTSSFDALSIIWLGLKAFFNSSHSNGAAQAKILNRNTLLADVFLLTGLISGAPASEVSAALGRINKYLPLVALPYYDYYSSVSGQNISTDFEISVSIGGEFGTEDGGAGDADLAYGPLVDMGANLSVSSDVAQKSFTLALAFDTDIGEQIGVGGNSFALVLSSEARLGFPITYSANHDEGTATFTLAALDIEDVTFEHSLNVGFNISIEFDALTEADIEEGVQACCTGIKNAASEIEAALKGVTGEDYSALIADFESTVSEKTSSVITAASNISSALATLNSYIGSTLQNSEVYTVLSAEIGGSADVSMDIDGTIGLTLDHTLATMSGNAIAAVLLGCVAGANFGAAIGTATAGLETGGEATAAGAVIGAWVGDLVLSYIDTAVEPSTKLIGASTISQTLSLTPTATNWGAFKGQIAFAGSLSRTF